MKEFRYSPSKWVPFRDVKVLERVRNIRREEIDKHPNPVFNIKVVPDNQVEFIFVTDMFYRIKKTLDEGQNCAELRPPEGQIHGPTTKNINDYGKMIMDMGGPDACYSGPGWTGHLAFIEPDSQEFEADLEDWKKMGTRIVTLSPFTIAQNSLHGSFGMSGDLSLVPPKAATIGPAEVIAARYRMQQHALSVAGTRVSWQRLITRLVLHGPVTPKVPESLLQTLPTDVIVSENAAGNIEPCWNFGY